MLRGVYLERTAGILLPRLRDQNDKRRAQHDRFEFLRTFSVSGVKRRCSGSRGARVAAATAPASLAAPGDRVLATLHFSGSGVI